MVNDFGKQALAGFSAAARIENFAAVPWVALSSSMSTFTAQNIGAGKNEQIRLGFRTTNKLIAFFGILFMIVLELSADSIIRFFLDKNISDRALEVGTGYITFLGWCSYLLGFKMCVDGMLRGAADTRAFTVANLVNLSLRVAISFSLAPKYGVSLVWIASPIG